MKRFITAGAGSGKTYTVTTEVAKRVKEEGLRPEQVIMTTFTKAAAQELREKAKKELVKVGCYKEAQQMEHALIGTVHSVANTFLSKYWYLLGIMPDACAMEEDEQQSFRNQSLRGLMSQSDRQFVYSYCEKYEVPYPFVEKKPGLNYEFWKGDLCKVLDYMQWYNITDEQLDKSLHDTTESIIKLLEPTQGISLNNPPQSLRGIYDKVVAVVDASRKSAKKESQLAFLDNVNLSRLSIEDVKSLEDIIVDRKLTEEASEYMEWAAELVNFPSSIASDHRRYAEIIFRLAKQWRSMYRAFKDENHLIDFNDMEEMFLELLGMEEVQQDIKSRFSCLYVDEFQDSNPIQVKIFQKLSTLIDACYVGDKKQAIYGFRGSDTELTTAVADSIEEKSTLKHSYRSIEPLVNLSNKVFTEIFDGMEDVTLTMPDENGNKDKEETPLRLWQWEKDKDLALQIQQFILREKIAFNDIAVLARNNEGLDKLADELRTLGVPVCRENDNVKDSRAGRLVKALLTLMATPGNLLARAEIAYLTEPGFNLTNIIEKRLDNIASDEQANKDYLKEIPIIARLEALRNEIKAQSVSAMLESLVIELNLYALAQRWDNALAEETNFQVLVDLAKKYEESATKLARPATVAGFIDYFCNQKQKGAADNSGVRLFTYHKSKGLEWKVVIMLSLEYDVQDYNKIAKNSFFGCHTHREVLPIAENPNPPMRISLVRNVYAQAPTAVLPPVIQARIQQHPLWEKICEAQKQEQARLLYVGVTRARNILVLAAKGKDAALNLNWFRSTGLESVKQVRSAEKQQDVLGIGVPFTFEQIDSENLLTWVQTKKEKVFDIMSDFSALDRNRNLAPSKAGKSVHNLGKILNDKENRIPESVAKNEEAYARMGDFIHQVFCCMDDNLSVAQIKQLRNSYGFTEKNMPSPELLADSWKYLIDRVEKEYGKVNERIHEMPFRHLDEEGRLITGYIDLVLKTESGFVIVDYKTCAGSYNLVFKPGSEHYAGCHGDQLDCYQRALEARDKKVIARLIYYPVTGFLMEVE